MSEAEPRGGAPEIVRAEDAQIERAAALVRGGQVVAFPTETSYGLAADALCPAAVERVAQAKGRGAHHPMPVLVADVQMLACVVLPPCARARALIGRHWPGALTLVLPGVGGLPAGIVNEAGGVGVRISADPIARKLVAAVGRPITATSANATGAPPAEVARAAARAGIALVLDDGPRTEPPSTVVAVRGETVVVLRQGALRIDDGPGDHGG